MKHYFILYAIVLMVLCQGCDPPNSTAWHWKQIERYNEYINNPKNLKQDQYGSYLDNVPDIMPSLCVLEEAGEITHLDLVFPNVPYTREVTKYWMVYAEKDADIILATGNPSGTRFQISGIQPVHLNIWFKPVANEKVEELIKGIENFGN